MISKELFPRKVLTNRGMIDVQDVYAGDYLYEWKTGNHLEVKDVKMIMCHNMYEVKYSDGRIEYHTDIEPAYLDQLYIPPHHPFCKCLKTRHYPIQLWPTQFDRPVMTPLDPDPYVAAALLIYGDQDDPYLNWPVDRTEAFSQLSYKYHIDYFPQTTGGKAYFQWAGKITDHRITWDEFFDHHSFYGISHIKGDTFIPREYLYAPYEERRKFIRGLFDMGYVQDRSPDTVAIFHHDKEKLESILPILWSMGFICEIGYDDACTNDRVWRLDIKGKYDNYPGFFYHRPYIENMIDSDSRMAFHQPNFSVTIVEVNPLENCECMLHNPIPHIVLERPHMIYTSTNFLPRVSI